MCVGVHMCVCVCVCVRSDRVALLQQRHSVGCLLKAFGISGVIKLLGQSSSVYTAVYFQQHTMRTGATLFWRGGGGDNFFLPSRSVLLATELKMDKLKNWGEIGGKCCMYIKDWFKPIFRLFLTSLLCKLKFLILMVDFAPPPPSRIVINQITPVPLRLCITYILIGKVSNVNKLLYLCIYLWFI